MAHLHNEISPLRAKARALARPASAAPSTAWAVRFALVLAVLLSLFLVGHAAARATESLAIGIIAADLAFLIVVAAWSTVAVAKRH